MRDGLKVTLAVSLESVGFLCQSIEEGLIILSFRLAYVQPRIFSDSLSRRDARSLALMTTIETKTFL